MIQTARERFRKPRSNEECICAGAGAALVSQFTIPSFDDHQAFMAAFERQQAEKAKQKQKD